jgi:hypothetical protein
MTSQSNNMVKFRWKYEILSCKIKTVKGQRDTMCRHERKIEMDGKHLAKGITPRGACPDEPFEDLLDGPLPAG